MKPYIRLVGCFGGMLIVAGVICCRYTREAFKTIDDAHDPVGSLRDLQSERRRSNELDAQRERILRWQEQMGEVVRAVIASRITLLEAAARFRELDRQLPEFNWEMFRQAYPGSSDAERHCRHVIASAEAELCRRPQEAAGVVARLEAELQEHLKRDGAICLPDVRP